MPWLRSDDASDRRKSSASASAKDALNPTTLVATAVLTTLALASARVYRTRLTRIFTAAHIPPTWLHENVRFFPSRHSVFGTVLRVSDGDGVRIYHSPGGRLLGWGWLRKVPTEPFPRQKRGTGGDKSWLAENTINVRLSGIDAPELAHFGHPAQPGATEATERLKELALNRRVRLYPHVNDQYGRIVGTVYVKRWHLGAPLGLRRWVDAGAEMVRDGWATVYEGKVGVAFGGEKREELLQHLQDTAKNKKIGIWRGHGGGSTINSRRRRRKDIGIMTRIWRRLTGTTSEGSFESPREFKARMKKQDDAEKGKG